MIVKNVEKKENNTAMLQVEIDVEIQEHPGKYGQPPQREHGHVPPGRKFKIIAHENTPFRELWLKCSRGDEVSSVPPVIVCNIRTRSRPRAGCV